MRPASTCCLASLPIVVVLPTPLTPTNIHTLVAPSSSASKFNDRSDPASRDFISASSASSSAAGSVISLSLTRVRSPPSSSSAMLTPISARSNASSNSSNDSSVIADRLSTPEMAPAKVERALASRSRSVPAGGSSTTGSSATAGSSTSVSPVDNSSAGRGGAAGCAAVRCEGACTPSRRRLRTTTPTPKAMTSTARIRKMISIPMRE